MTGPLSRRTVLALGALGTVSLAGCLSNDDSEPPASPEDGNPTADPDEVGLPTAESQLPLEYSFETLEREARSGGPGPDGIPSIDEPVFEPVSDVGDRIGDDEPVFGVIHNGEARAYPQSILVYHEIVNDDVGGEPLAVTYCPLTGTAMGFERGDVEFGVSGSLANNNLIMFDRATESWWPQMLATSMSGDLQGYSLREVPVHWVRWADWRTAYPDADVLTEDTGYLRDYDDEPYGSYADGERSGYYEDDASPMFPELATDDRYPPKRMVLGARPPEGPLAIDLESLRTEGLLEFDHDGVAMLAVHEPTLDVGIVYRNPDGVAYTFEDGDGTVTDEDGDSYDPSEVPLESVYAYEAMWFAWAGYYPSTRVFD